MKIERTLVGLILLLGTIGCAPTIDEPAPEKTPVGTPITGATKASGTIGAAGGSLTSSDGRVTLNVPAGALSADATIEITPISNEAHGGIGNAYDLTGVETFQKPVTLTFAWTDDELEGTAPPFLDVAFQNADGFWQLVDSVEIDADAKTITATTTHFTRYAFVARFRLNPAGAKLKVNGAKVFQLEHSFPILGERPRPGSDRPVLGFSWSPVSVTYGAKVASEWSVNGIAGGDETVGTIYADLERGGYAAPEKKPTPDTVKVTVRVTNPFKPRETGLIAAKVTITDQDKINVRATYSKHAQLLTTFVTGDVTDNGFQFEMSFPPTTEEPMVRDVMGGSTAGVMDSRSGCITPTVNGDWDELTATNVSITGSFLTVQGTHNVPPITLGSGEGNCAVDVKTEPASTTAGGIQVSLPPQLLDSTTAPDSVSMTQDGWTFVFTAVR